MSKLGLKFDFDSSPDMLTFRFLEDDKEFVAFDMQLPEAEAFFKDALMATRKRMMLRLKKKGN